jgi:signal transduction histidine kinase
MMEMKFKNANILIVDDQQPNVDLLEGFLEMEGYQNIKTTTDPREVISLFSQFKPDLILLDLSMPYLSGFDVMEQLRPLININTLLPILVLTADITSQSKQKALSEGASDFLTKPFDLIEVGMRIHNLLYASYLQQQLLSQNQLLELKVQERTAELEKLNVNLLAAKNKAEASDRLKTAFLQTISHEVRTPLNGILGFATLLVMPDLSVDEKKEYLVLMENSSDRLIKTITDYVDMSLIASRNLEDISIPFNVAKLLNQVKEKFQCQCDSKGLILNLLIPDDHLEYTIHSDPYLIEKVFSQLIDNAIKFTTAGSVKVEFQMKDNSIDFFVRDSGIGIGDDVQEVIFEKFMQEDISATRSFEGSGLGLSIIKGILKHLGGTINFESVKGEGTTFYFSLPIHRH